MNGYKGAIVFYKSTDPILEGSVFTMITPSVEAWKERSRDIFLGSCEVDVEFEDTRETEIEALEKSIQQERAESHRRVEIMQGRINDLLSLPCPPEAEPGEDDDVPF